MDRLLPPAQPSEPEAQARDVAAIRVRVAIVHAEPSKPEAQAREFSELPRLRFGLTSECNRRTRARRAIASFVLSFLAIQVGLLWLLESSHGLTIDAEFQTHLRQARELRQTSPETPFLLALGSSRLQMALDPEAIDDDATCLVYNSGIAGFGSTQMEYGLRRYLRAGLRPDFLLLEINPGWAHWDPPIHTRQQVERMTIAESLGLIPYSHGLAWTCETLAKQRVLPSHTLRKKILLQAAPQWLPHQTVAKEVPTIYPRGGAKVDFAWIPDERRAVHVAAASKQYEEALRSFHISTPSDAALQSLLTLCEEKKIPVAILLTPEGPHFRSFYRDGGRADFVAWIKAAASAHKAEVIDTWTWCAEDDFFDSHHMLAKPAARYTARLWEERLRAWLIGHADCQ